MDESTIRLTNRHIAKLLGKLDQVKIADIVKDTIRVHMRYLAEDIEQEQKNGAYEERRDGNGNE